MCAAPRDPFGLLSRIAHSRFMYGVLSVGYQIQHNIKELEEKYPALPQAQESDTLRKPWFKKKYHSGYAELCIAQIPLKALETRQRRYQYLFGETNQDQLDAAWSTVVRPKYTTPLSQFILAAATDWRFMPRLTDSENGSQHNYWVNARYDGLVVEMNIQAQPVWRNARRDLWDGTHTFPDKYRVFCDNISLCGLPWRTLWAVRFESSVSQPFQVEGGEWYVEVRWGYSHDYRTFRSETRQKTMPSWCVGLWRLYFRWMFDCAVRRLLQDYEDKHRGKDGDSVSR